MIHPTYLIFFASVFMLYNKLWNAIRWTCTQKNCALQKSGYQLNKKSCAIAKMTARFGLYMGTLKTFGTPCSPWLYAHSYFSQKFSWAFVSIDPMNGRIKFEVRSFTCSWDNRGYPKNWVVPTPTLPFFQSFQYHFVQLYPVNGPAKFEIRSFTFLG